MASLSSRVMAPSSLATLVAIGAGEPAHGQLERAAAAAPPPAPTSANAEHARAAAAATAVPRAPRRRRRARRRCDVSGVTDPPALVASVTRVTLFSATLCRIFYIVNK